MQVRNYIKKYGVVMFFEKILAKLFGVGFEVQYRKREEAFWKLKNKDAIKQELKIWYEEQMGEKIDLEHPITFTEKIQWMKINDMDELKTKLADKWEVREWIKEKIGEEYLVPVYGIFEDYDEIDFAELPEKFVIKANHGSGMVFVVNDKKKINHKKLRQKTKIWKATNYAYQNGFEMQYKNQKRRILVEKYINEIDKNLVDYKFHCFNGKVDFIQVICDRNVKTHEISHCFLNKNWKKTEKNWGGMVLEC